MIADTSSQWWTMHFNIISASEILLRINTPWSFGMVSIHLLILSTINTFPYNLIPPLPSATSKIWGGGGYAIPTSFQNCSPHNLWNSHFAYRINSHISISHVPWKSNYKSNLASRVLNLLTALFRLVCTYFGQLPQVDLCASHLNKQLKITKVMLQTHLLNM